MKEIWRDIIIDNENTGWKVSNLGRLRRSRDNKITYGSNDGKGYRRVRIKNNYYFVHRLVALEFIPNPENKTEIDHINTIRSDNRIENLRWCTVKENNNNKLTREKYSKSQIGGNNSFARKVKCIETGEIFESTADAVRKYNLKTSSVRSAANPKCNQRTAGGYHWEYVS